MSAVQLETVELVIGILVGVWLVSRAGLEIAFWLRDVRARRRRP